METLKNKILQKKRNIKYIKNVIYFFLIILFGFFFLVFQYFIINISIKNEYINNILIYIHDFYYYLFNINKILSISVLIFNSLLLSLIVSYIIFINFKNIYYIDEFTTSIINDNISSINKEIKILNVLNIKDIGNKYRIKINLFNINHKRETINIDVEKWKVII